MLVTGGAQAFTLDDPDFEAIGSPLGMGSLLDSRTEPGENVLALKVTYWIPVR